MKKEKNIIKVQRYESPCGLLVLGSFGDKLCLCDWQVEKHRDHVDRRLKRMLCSEFEVGTSEVIEKAARQLDEFFAGKRKEFDVPLLFVGTDFQKTVWNELLEIPFGKTVSYGEMAQRIGMSKAVRAVANANGANSISIFAPCHRVIGSDRALTGYGGWLPSKKFLLELGRGFMFVGTQQRITLGNHHYYVDMVFYNKILKAYVLIELKTSKLMPEAVGQLNMYLNYYAQEVNDEYDNQPIGIILCTDKGSIEAEYALGGISNQIFASKYVLYMPDKEQLVAQVENVIAQWHETETQKV